VLKWLREHGYPWNSDTMYHARVKKHADIIKWALENGCSETKRYISKYF